MSSSDFSFFFWGGGVGRGSVLRPRRRHCFAVARMHKACVTIQGVGGRDILRAKVAGATTKACQ